MPETAFREFIIPGTFVRVRAEALISAGGVSTGNIGIVGTARDGRAGTHILSDYRSAQETFGAYDAFAPDASFNLTRALEILYRNGARTVFARALDPGEATSGQDDFTAAFEELIKEDVNILVAPQLPTQTALNVLAPIVDAAEDNGRDVIAVVGSDADTVANITADVRTNDRLLLTTPGLRAFDAAANNGAGADVDLPGRYSAAAVAGLLSTLSPEASPTNKVLSGVAGLTRKFSYGEKAQLVQGRVLVLEERNGVRVVRGITTDDGAFQQITTRRITDFAKAGVRRASDPFIGRLNNQRVRKALQGAINGFLTTMVVDEMLISYSLEVTATRADEIAGRCVVNAILRPTFSIDFIAVTMVLE